MTASTQDYFDTLLRYYEEEIAGEAYFYALSEHSEVPDKLILLARVERIAAQALQPLLQRYGLVPRDESIVKQEGVDFVVNHAGWSWHRFMTHIVERYPGYLDEFEALEAIGPVEDQPALQHLTQHEIAVIDFARRELDGDPDSIAPLLAYLD